MDFVKAYRKCKRTNALSGGVESVRQCLNSIGGEVVSVEKVVVDYFASFEGYKVVVGDDVAFFPIKLDPMNSSRGLDYVRVWCAASDIVVPPYFGIGLLFRASKILEDAPDEQRIIAGGAFLRSIYTVEDIAQIVIGVFCKRSVFAPYIVQITESVKAYSLGLCHTAITGLLPCIEGVVRGLGVNYDMSVSTQVSMDALLRVFKKLVKFEIDLMFKDYSWRPSELDGDWAIKFHERVQIYGSVSSYIGQRLYKHTEDVDDGVKLNRHGISHGLFDGYASEANFLRLFNLLSALSLCAVPIEGGGSLMHPGATPESAGLTLSLKNCYQLRPLII